MATNPFKPSFGATPPLLAGREGDLDQFRESLIDGPGAPGRATIFTGARGVGKTVMLTEAAQAAAASGWISVDVTATRGMLDQIVEQAEATTAHLRPTPGRRITGVGASGWSVQTALPLERTPGWRTRMSAIMDTLAQHGTGLLITVDEVHRRGIDDLRELAAAYQHFVREDREIALVMAGLPAAVSDLLNDEVLTFLRRADIHRLRDVPLDEVREALLVPIRAAGRTIDEDALAAAAQATRGYPFLIQLVGYQIWRQHPDEPEISLEDVQIGAAIAQRRMAATVHEASLADASRIDRAFLTAMARSDGPVRTADVARILGTSSNYASQYRLRLIDAGLIQAAGHGWIDFAVPYLREYLREHPGPVEPR
ncbi:MAG: hypothetical protein WCF04_06275 [Candidatus Nanopelagicales bacterium]